MQMQSASNLCALGREVDADDEVRRIIGRKKAQKTQK
jgi:hypothetical protein